MINDPDNIIESLLERRVGDQKVTDIRFDYRAG